MNKNIYTKFAVILIVSIVIIMFIHGLYIYLSERAKTHIDLKMTADHSIDKLEKNIGGFIAAFAFQEYADIISSEMINKVFVAIIVHDKNMAKITGQKFFTVGKIRNDNWQVTDYDEKDEKHLNLLKKNFYKTERIIKNNSVEIGRIEIYVTDVFLKASLNKFIKRTIIQTITISFFLCIVILIFLKKIIIMPVRSISEGLFRKTDQVVSSSDVFASVSQSIAEDSSKQAVLIEETLESLEMILSIARHNANITSTKENFMKENFMKDMTQIVKNTSNKIDELAMAIKNISITSEEIFEIVKVIDDISFQTNLLSLNAAIEAARAGKAGSEFAIVADEVRNLSLKVSEAAKKISELIENMGLKLKQGSELMLKTNNAFSKVTESSSEITGLVSNIAAESDKQVKNTEQIRKSVAKISKMTQQNAANAQESAGTSQEMASQAESIKSFVKDFLKLLGIQNKNYSNNLNNRQKISKGKGFGKK